jgi:hypothetical protein
MRILYSTLCFLAALLLLFSCDNDSITDSFESGEDFTQSNIKVVQIDTFSLGMSTFRYDSITTSGVDRILVGRYEDPYFGKVKATGFIDFLPELYYIDDAAVLDSVVLNLPYDGFFYNDTLQQKTIKIQELTKEIRYKNDQTAFYNTTDVAANIAIIGQKTFRPRISHDSLTVTLNNSFGQNLFSKIQNSLINDSDQLTDYFKGLKISADDSENASIMGFKATTSYIRFYYKIPGDDATESQFLDFKYNSGTNPKHFSKIESDRTGTLLAGLAGQETEATAASLNNLSFIQSGIGITTKFTFPSIRNITTVNYGNGNGDIFKANLKIKLNNQYYNKKLYTSDSLYMYIVDQNNDYVSRLQDTGGNPIMAYVDTEDSETNEVYLIAPVAVFLTNSLNNADYAKYGIILTPSDFNSTTERMILNGTNNSNYKSRLELTYVIYDK